MALLPFYRREFDDWDLSPWRRSEDGFDLVGIRAFQDRFRSHAGGFLRDMDSQIIKMDEEMRRVMKSNMMDGSRDVGSFLKDLDMVKPTIVERDGQRRAQYNFDVRGFTPEEITIKTQDKTLEVLARHAERGPGREVSRETKRTITIPDGIDPEELQGKLVDDGILRIEAPYRPPALTQPEGSRLIPITHE